jgi:hypothetical protein
MKLFLMFLSLHQEQSKELAKELQVRLQDRAWTSKAKDCALR